MADDEVRISSSMDGDLEAALARLEQRLSGVEDKLDDVRQAGRRAGAGVDAGMDQASRATDKAARSSAAAAGATRRAGDEMSKAGTKGATASVGVDRFAEKMQKARRAASGLGSVLSIYKWAGIATAFFALAGGISALGAGAAIALGGLGPMVGTLAAIPVLLLGIKLSMLAVKLAASQLEDPLTRIKNQFSDLGPMIAGGGLASGLNFFADSVGALADATGVGLTGLGAELGLAARNVGELVRSGPLLNQVRVIFAELRPIMRNLLAGVLSLGRALLNIIQAALPMTTSMTELFRDAAEGLRAWTATALANGTMAAWLNKAWVILTRTVGVIVDILIGLFNIFRIGAGYAADMGASIETLAYRFRLWTASAEGQLRINQYFADSLPALHEMGRLVGGLLGGLARLGANQNLAPILKQINDELGPAIGNLVNTFVGPNGLAQALITALTALANFFAQMDLTVLVVFAQALASVINGILWISANVPGASGVISTLFSAFIAFKLLGPVFSIVAGGAKAFAWLGAANAMTGKLSFMQKIVGGLLLPSLRTLARAFGSLAVAGVRALITLSIALLTTPVGWIILGVMAIIAALVLLWIKCAWFRDAVKAVWNQITMAFFAVAGALTAAWTATTRVLATVINILVGFFVGLWRGAVVVVSTIWQGLVTAWNAVWSVLLPIVKVIFNIIRVIVQIHIFVIMALIALIAVTAEAVFKLIVMFARWAWETVLRPIFGMIASVAAAVWNGVTFAARTAWITIATIVMWFWQTVLQPILTLIVTVATAVWTGIATAAQFCWNLIMIGAYWLWQVVLQPIFMIVASAGSAIWQGISTAASTAWGVIKAVWTEVSGWFSGLFDTVGRAGSAIWDSVKTAASIAADLVKSAWNTVADAVKAVWNTIARVWNGIPSVQIPDWVPGLGGKTFSLPKMPELYAGGPAPAGPALVGEHGAELVVRGGRVLGMVGAQGPTIAQLPRGSYVVPNLRTVLAGMAKPIPAPVAAAVAATARGSGAPPGRDAALLGAVREVAQTLREQRPPLAVSGGEDTARAVLTALRDHDRERRARARYEYSTGEG